MQAKTSQRRRSLVGFGILCAGYLLLGLIGSVHAQAEANPTLYLPLIANDYDPSWQWSTAITVELTPAPYHPPLLTLDRSGRLHIVWDTLHAPRFIYHTYVSAQGWTTPAAVAQTLGISTIALPASVGPTGDLHVVWQNDLGNRVENRYRLMTARFDGVTWAAEEEIFHNPNGSIDGVPYTDAAGTLHIALAYSNLVTAKYVQFTLTQGLWMAAAISDPPKGSALTIAMWSPSRQGGLHFYADGFSDQLYYSYWQDGQFPVKAKAFKGKLWGRTHQADGDGNVHIFWTGQVPVPGGLVYGLSQQCLANNLAWGQPVIVSQQHTVNGAIVTATDALTQVVFAWTEENQHIRLAVWNSCTQTDKQEIPFAAVPTLNLDAIVISQAPPKFCALARQSSTGHYIALCADINR